jgi:hypothetical protein
MRVRIMIRDVVVAIVGAGPTLEHDVYAQEKPVTILKSTVPTGTHGLCGTLTSGSRARLYASPR